VSAGRHSRIDIATWVVTVGSHRTDGGHVGVPHQEDAGAALELVEQLADGHATQVPG